MKHELKIKPEYFAAIYFGEKTFEIRNNADRNFQVGDTLMLKAWDGEFNGDFVEKVVSYITDFEQKPGYVVLGLVNHREHELLEKFHRTGVAIERAISTGSVLADHPLKSRLELLANHHEREMELAAQLSDATRQCGVMAGLLLEAQRYVRYRLEYTECDARIVMGLICDIDAALAGKLPDPAVTVTETIRTAPERIWLQVGDQEHYHSEPFPRDTSEVSWCADSVVGCEVPYVRADLAGKLLEPAMPEGWKLVEKANCFTLVSNGQVIASMAGPTAEGTAAILASVLDGRVSRPANQDELVSVSDIASLQRYTLGGNCDSFGQDCGAEMERDDEGEYVLLADALTLSSATKPEPTKGRTITEGQEFELTTVLQSIVGGFSDDPAHDAAALLKRIAGEVPWTGDSFLIPPRQGGEPCVSASPSSSPD
ncbi:DUF3850 domain-containing protein [Aeromonas salmonicida]|uniref:ASCH/PUA domain-containing protein n=1 Tax=Aeromonas salmonicida TaxID=645 RepID=UPI00223F5E55|nr:ASCH/PUA domain-containing protein [Aeromonas salmonicida]MDF8330531.1 DUF3850 domain-containing protein [Aeromonas salmonicida]